MLLLVSFSKFTLYKSIWSVTYNIIKRTLVHKEMSVSEERKEITKIIYLKKVLKKKRRTSI